MQDLRIIYGFRHGHQTATQYGNEYEYVDTANIKNIEHQHRYILIKDVNLESKYIHVHISSVSYCIIEKVLKKNNSI
jgi:hypothetical protein